jgi:hypothetical protein
MATPRQPAIPLRPIPAGLILAAMIALAPSDPAAQTPRERQQAYERCYRDAARRFGPPPRQEPRPGEDLVELARRRQDYEDRYGRFMSNCLADADQRLYNKRAQ